MQIRIRVAEPRDAAQIADIHVRTWQHAYRGLMPDSVLDGLDVAARTARWERILAASNGEPGASTTAEPGTPTPGADPVSTTEVAVDGDRLVGFASAGAAREENAPCPRELWALYVEPSAHGSGAGAALLRAAIGADPAYLWVLDGNARAIAFYEKHGFRADGGVKLDDRGEMVLRELRMVRD